MIRALLVAALLMVSAPAAAQDVDDDAQWVCSASAKGKGGSRFDVGVHVDNDGEVLTRYISWTPPMLDDSKPRYPDLSTPGLTLYYEDAEADDIGVLTRAVGDVSSVGGPDGALRHLALWLLMDGGANWAAELEAFGPGHKIGDAPFRYASADVTDTDWDGDPLESLETGSAVTLSLRDTAGRPVAQARYDLTARAERDRLFRTAWHKAERMAKKPKQCDKTGSGEDVAEY